MKTPSSFSLNNQRQSREMDARSPMARFRPRKRGAVPAAVSTPKTTESYMQTNKTRRERNKRKAIKRDITQALDGWKRLTGHEKAFRAWMVPSLQFKEFRSILHDKFLMESAIETDRKYMIDPGLETRLRSAMSTLPRNSFKISNTGRTACRVVSRPWVVSQFIRTAYRLLQRYIVARSIMSHMARLAKFIGHHRSQFQREHIAYIEFVHSLKRDGRFEESGSSRWTKLMTAKLRGIFSQIYDENMAIWLYMHDQSRLLQRDRDSVIEHFDALESLALYTLDILISLLQDAGDGSEHLLVDKEGMSFPFASAYVKISKFRRGRRADSYDPEDPDAEEIHWLLDTEHWMSTGQCFGISLITLDHNPFESDIDEVERIMNKEYDQDSVQFKDHAAKMLIYGDARSWIIEHSSDTPDFLLLWAPKTDGEVQTKLMYPCV